MSAIMASHQLVLVESNVTVACIPSCTPVIMRNRNKLI